MREELRNGTCVGCRCAVQPLYMSMASLANAEMTRPKGRGVTC